jgi:extradiol dioxygenase family protein
MRASNPFHLAIPVSDLDVTLAFYEEHLGCSRGRESHDWVDLNFFGHQLVLHRSDEGERPGVNGSNPVDGEQVPVPHFGVVLQWQAFEALIERLMNQDCEFLIEPTTRFKGRAGEQKTCFLMDPSKNCLEFKSFRDPDALFSIDNQTYV